MIPSNTTPPHHHAPAGPVVAFDTWCVSCGYNVVRLPKGGACPACGTPIETTLSSNLLKNSSPDYVATLRKGVSLILNSVLLMIGGGMLGGIALMAVTVANGPPMTPPSSPFQSTPPPLWWSITFGAVMLAFQAMQMYGLWLFTRHDSSFSGRHDATSIRTWIRNLILITVTLTVVQWVVQQFTSHVGITIAFVVLGLVVWVPLGCTQMAYIRWLAPRLPDARVAERAKLMLWLYPLLSTVGILMCVGPLVALILYWNLLNWVRQDLKYLLDRRAYDQNAADLIENEPS